MLKPINQISNRVAEGRRFASRSIVITSLSSITAYAYRRAINPAEEGETRDETVYEGGISLSDFEAHAVEYSEQGFVMMLLDKFTGGSIHSDGDDINSGEGVFYAQIEPINLDDYGNRRNMLTNIPTWKPIKGDVFALLIDEDLIKWIEVIGVKGQSLHAHHGEQYVLNVRDKLMHLDPFIQNEETLLPVANRFPILLSDLTYNDASIFNVVTNSPDTMADDEITTKIFKLVNFDDVQVSSYMAVMAIKHMSKSTNSPYYFDAIDQAKITVDISHGENFILSSSEPVKAIETSLGNLTNLLLMIDHVNTVKLIKESLIRNQPVKIIRDLGTDFEATVFEFLPAHYDEVRKAYHCVLMVGLGKLSAYALIFSDGDSYSFNIDTINVEAVE